MDWMEVASQTMRDQALRTKAEVPRTAGRAHEPHRRRKYPAYESMTIACTSRSAKTSAL